MKNHLFAIVCLILLLLGAAPSAADPITDTERQRLLDHLGKTRDQFLAAVEGLNEAQWNFKPTEDRWSIGEVAEHIAVAEDFIRGATEGALATKATAEQMAAAGGKEDQVLEGILDRTQKFQAPEPVEPAQRFASMVETLEAYQESRAATMKLAAEGGNFRAHVSEHPAFGPLDAYGWLFFLSGHSERHVAQIEEVKEAEGYPRP